MGIMSNCSQGDTHCRESKTSEFSVCLQLSYLLLILTYPYPLHSPFSPPPLLESSPTPSPYFCVFYLFFSAPYSKPVVTLEPESNLRPGDEVALTCVAYGGYPVGDVIWQDGGGRNLTDNITTSVVANEEGLFTISSVLTVVLEPNSTYSCRLINPLLGEEGYAFVTITGGIWRPFFYAYKQLLCLSVNIVICAYSQSKHLSTASCFLQCLSVGSLD